MIKKIYTNGCSMTKFEKVSEPLQWPNLVRQQLNIDQLINDGYGCGSNQRIFRTTFDFVNSKGFDPNETLILIQMTYPFRFEFKEPDGKWAAVNQNHSISSNSEYAEKYRKLKIDSFSHEEEQYEYLQKLFAINALLNTAQVKNYFFMNFYLPIEDHKILKMLDKNFEWVVKGSAFDSQFPIYERLIGDDTGHPGPAGYVTIANWIVKHIKNRIK